MFYLVAALAALIDQLVKNNMEAVLVPGRSVPVFGDLVYFTYVQNTGAAFSLFRSHNNALIFVALAVSLIVIYVHFRISEEQKYIQFCLGLILGGSLGNLIDRFMRGYVVDYIDIKVWPVFNFADMMINLGVVLLILKILFAKEVD